MSVLKENQLVQAKHSLFHTFPRENHYFERKITILAAWKIVIWKKNSERPQGKPACTSQTLTFSYFS